MKIVEHYNICETCGTEYRERLAAKSCEKCHKNAGSNRQCTLCEQITKRCRIPCCGRNPNERRCFTDVQEVKKMRLIDADEALELFRAEYKNTENLIKQGESQLDNLAEGYTEAAHIIRYNLPTVDAVQVVRCRDCVKRGTGDCPMEQDYPWISTDSDAFCSYGEQKK